MRIYGPGFFITEVIFLQMIVQHPEGGSAGRLGEYKPAKSLVEREQLRALISYVSDWGSIGSRLNRS